jgi:hypothetical protein
MKIQLKDSNLMRAVKNVFLKRNNIIVVEPRYGLGDSIVCNGIVRELAKKNPQKIIYYACPNLKNYHSILWMLYDLSNVYVIALKYAREARQLSGFWNATYIGICVNDSEFKLNQTTWDNFYYKTVNLNLELKWDNVNIKEGVYARSLEEELNPSQEKYILVCNSGSEMTYQLEIENPQRLKIIIFKPITNNIFDWVSLIKNASEIHTIDTVLVHLAESILHREFKPPQLFLHLIKSDILGFSIRLPWKMIYYK